MAKATATPDVAAIVAAVMAAMETGGKVEGATAKLKARGEATKPDQCERPVIIDQFDEETGTMTITCQITDWQGKETEKGNVSVCSGKFDVKPNGSPHWFEVKFSVLRESDEFDKPFKAKA